MRGFVPDPARRLNIAVVGSGISGLSAAWLLSQRHRVTVFEAARHIGGHSNTVEVGGIAVDTGFIVYNQANYPNLTALFRHLDVPTRPSDMSFAVSLDGGRLEYSGTGLDGLFAQRGNLYSPRFWSMLRDLLRFYRSAPRDVGSLGSISLDEYLDRGGYGSAVRQDHLFPMAAAIWSAPMDRVGSYPAAFFIRFCDNHGLLKLGGRPVWRTVVGGSREYVARLTRDLADRIVTGHAVHSVRRLPNGVELRDAQGRALRFDHAIVAAHADEALAMLADPSRRERQLLGVFGYTRNEAVLHTDASLMPARRKVWSSWNYLSRGHADGRQLCVTYWMNRLQGIPEETSLFVTLNPIREPAPGRVIRREIYHHPVFDAVTDSAQRELWSLQGQRNTWFCGAYFGAGFHEDGLQAGLAVAEELGGVKRPWTVPDESARIHVERFAPRGPALDAVA